MKRLPEAEAKRWLAQAEEDLSSARYLLEGGRFYLVCFLAQQVAEKAVKAYLYAQGEELILGHSVEELCQWAGERDKDFKDMGEGLSILDNYYLPSRYPNALPSSIPAKVFNKKVAAEALELAEKAVGLVKEKLAPCR